MNYKEYGSENKEVIMFLPGLYHGEFSLTCADDYVREVELILNGVK